MKGAGHLVNIMTISAEYDPCALPDLLPIYYKRLFPFDQYYRWLSYGNVPSSYFPHREFSYTLADDIYIRYQSFKDQEEMEKEIQRKCPQKIDIGAVFSSRPKDHRTVSVFTPLEKELVFDIDMTDYDEVRYCCSGAEICNKCWKYMTVAIEILDRALREDFGFKHILWVYSGRRGVHCWVCDEGARALSQSGRSAVAEYLQVIRGGENQNKKVSIHGLTLHPLLSKSLEIIDKYFKSICLEDQDIFGDSIKTNKVLALIPDSELRASLSQVMPKCSSSEQKWETIKTECENFKSKKGHWNNKIVLEMMLQLVYPRLDINVSKGLNHLLKSPFSIHPKTGRVCVPIDPANASSFDPLAVPTISHLINEVNNSDTTCAGADDGNIQDCKKTSMKKPVQIMEKFLAGLSKENAARRLKQNDMKMEF